MSKKGKIVLFVVFFYIIAVAAAAVLIDARHVKFIIKGQQTITVAMGEKFTDPGSSAVVTGRLFGDGKPLSVSTTGEVDTGKLGSYTLEYSVKWLGRKFSTERTVNVTDQDPPVITLKHKEGYAPSWFTGYEEEGYSAFDNNDGDISARVQRTEEDGLISYSVTDSSGNTAFAQRRIPDIEAPRFELIGGEDLHVNAGLSFKDPGIKVTDGLGNDLSQYVTLEGDTVQPYTPGTYELRYSIENGLGESVVAVRHVTVEPVRCPDSVTPGQKTIYLTFDDGPGPYTDALLDVLAKYNAKATFFVTASYPKYIDCIGRAFNEGHAIGVHTTSHNYYTIYASEEDYFEDFFAMEEIIYEQTGEYTQIFRFPGGSSNTVSGFNPGIMTRLAQAMTDMGYRYFDWNVTSGDAGETTKTSVVIDNVISGCEGKNVAVVLQHDIKDFSVDAVEKIILWGLQNGYAFCALDASSPGAHHGIAN